MYFGTRHWWWYIRKLPRNGSQEEHVFFFSLCQKPWCSTHTRMTHMTHTPCWRGSTGCALEGLYRCFIFLLPTVWACRLFGIARRKQAGDVNIKSSVLGRLVQALRCRPKFIDHPISVHGVFGDETLIFGTHVFHEPLPLGFRTIHFFSTILLRQIYISKQFFFLVVIFWVFFHCVGGDAEIRRERKKKEDSVTGRQGFIVHV